MTLLSNCSICNSKKSRFIKEQGPGGLLLGSNSPFRRISLISSVFQSYKMNEIVKRFLLAGDKYMSEMRFREPGFTYSAWETFIKNKEWIQKFKGTEDWKIQNIFIKTN